MPIPEPESNEEQGHFIARCVAGVPASDGDVKTRTAICYDAWRRKRGITDSEAIDASFSSRAKDDGRWDWVAASDEYKDEGDKIARRFVKGVIRVGSFHKASEKKTFVVTPATLSYWSETFHKMKERGVKVWIPRSHDDAHLSDHNRGWVDDLFVVDDTLFMSCRLIGKDAISAAQRNDVSIHCPAEWTDDGGHRYAMPIRHIALCPDPVVSGLSRFVEVNDFSERSNIMQWWESLAKELGLSDVTAENALAKISGAIKTLKAPAKPDVSASDSDGDKPKDSGGSLSSGKSDKPKFRVSPVQLSTIANARRAQVYGLIEKGKITAGVGEKIVGKYVGGEKAEKLALTLSSDVADDFDEVMAMFEQNSPIELAERTRAQHPGMVVLSNDTAGDGKSNPLIDNAEARAKAAQ